MQCYYLQNILKESEIYSNGFYDKGNLTKTIALRLYPSVPVNSRTAIRNTVLPTGGGPDYRSPIFYT